jgi:hypothetical protein
MPKRGVVPPQFRAGYVPKSKRAGRAARRYYGGARRAASGGRRWLAGGGPIATGGMVIGGVLGATPALTKILEPGDYTPGARARQAVYEFSGVGVSGEGKITSFDPVHGITNVVMTAGGAIMGRVGGRLVEHMLGWLGINTKNPLGV